MDGLPIFLRIISLPGSRKSTSDAARDTASALLWPALVAVQAAAIPKRKIRTAEVLEPRFIRRAGLPKGGESWQ